MKYDPDWQAARRDVQNAERKRLVEPPTAEEMLAFERGQLDEREEERVREALVAWPELARAMSTEFPEEGDDVDIDEQWTRFQREAQQPPKADRTFVWFAVAATVAIVFGGLYWRAERQLRAFDQPRVLTAAPVLQPGGSRGPNDAATRVHAGDAVRLAVHETSDSYRVELRDATKTLWTSDSVQAGDDHTIAVLLPRALAPGRYQLVLFDARGEELAAYALRVSPS